MTNLELSISMKNRGSIYTFIRNKWYHFIFWLGYFSFWLCISGVGLTKENILINLLFLFCSIVPSYLAIYLFLPKFLKRQRYFIFFALLILSTLGFAGLLYLLLKGYFTYAGIQDESFFIFPNVLGPTLGSVTTSVVGFLTGKLIKDYVKTEKLNNTLKQEKLATELKFLKSQLNPHFLFNALNNIYFLIKKDQDLAADSLAKFSDIMRYQLYECNDEKVLLTKELEIVKSFMELFSLAKSESTNITIVTPERTTDEMISPLLIQPIIENCFKHVAENVKGENFITINIMVEGEKLICKSSNSFDPDAKDKVIGQDIISKESGGLGLKNLLRRLSILYPGNHTFEYSVNEGIYQTRMTINL